MRFREIWSKQPTLRLAKLGEATEVFHNRYVAAYVPTTIGQTRIPDSLRDDSSLVRTARTRSMTFDIERIYNPQNILFDFTMTDCDEEAGEYDIRSGVHHRWIERTVAMVDLPRLTGVGMTTDYIASLASYFQRQGFTAEDPDLIYRMWCEIEGVQPVAEGPPTMSPEMARAVRRLSRLVDGAPGCGFDVDQFVNRVLASTGHPRSAPRIVDMMSRAILTGENAGDALAYLDSNQADSFRAARLLHDTRHREAEERRRASERDARNEVDIADMIRRYADPPASVVASAGGVLIPTDHPGRRAIIIE